MHTFFHGWRRKAGVVSLVMACVSCSLWLRSLGCEDRCVFYLRDFEEIVSSADGILAWARTSQPSDDLTLIKPSWYNYDRPDVTFFHNPAIEWRLKWFGFGIGRVKMDDGSYINIGLIPYWSLAIPLTLLSAYLILWKPRKSDSLR